MLRLYPSITVHWLSNIDKLVNVDLVVMSDSAVFHSTH